ncbi:DUF2079 domain-containing protein [Pilimelia columellifera]|uniref:DUF2079 domain-containing protein n=1 Tax=Pilimelia columellifera subsp. columellifera TaxID=706583 RepID=A0ABP6AEI1_9ACTN
MTDSQPKLDLRRARLTTGALCVVFFALYSAVSLLRFANLGASGYDLGIFTQAVRAYAEGRAPIAELKADGYHLLGDHFHPVLALLAPFYKLFPTPATLLVGQALLFAVAVWPITRVAMQRLGLVLGAAVGAAFGLSFGAQQAVLFDFHEIAFSVPLLAFSVSALLQRRWLPATLWALPMLLVKEDQFLIIAAIGAYIFWEGGRRVGAMLAVGAAAAGALTLFVIIPSFNVEGQYDYLNSVAPESNGLLRLLVPREKWELLFILFAITAFVAARSPLALLVALPLAARFWAVKPAYWSTEYQYNAILMPVLFAAFLDGLGRLQRDQWWRRAVARVRIGRLRGNWLGEGSRLSLVAVAALLAIAVGWTVEEQPIGQLARPATWEAPRNAAEVRYVLASVPDGASVAADNLVAPYLVTRAQVYLFPDALVMGTRPAWVLVKDDPGGWPISPKEYAKHVAALPGQGYIAQIHSAGLRLYRLTRPTVGVTPVAQ